MVFALRFRAYGRRRYLTLGTPAEGWTRGRGEEEMDAIRGEVDRGAWVPPPPRRRMWGGGDGGDDGAPFGSFAGPRSGDAAGKSRRRPSPTGSGP